VRPQTFRGWRVRCLKDLYNLPERSPSDDGHYRLIVAATGKCLGVSEESQDLRAQIRQYSCDSGWSQQWDLRPTDNDYYEVVARHSNKCMDVQGDYVGPGANIWQYDCDLGPNQQFRFVPPSRIDGRIEPEPLPVNPG
jgi:Ricin-type beta-trefoil lectin domain-like